MLKLLGFIGVSIALISTTYAREQVRVVGSSTVYPFTTVVAEEFGRKTDFKTPVVEATGTGGGMRLFCGGIGDQYPDFLNASRVITQREFAACKKNNVLNISEIHIGFDGIVFANSVEALPYELTTEQLFLALARQTPSNGQLIDNPFVYWSDIDPAFPKIKIAIYGPPPTSGTRDALIELVMEKVCFNLKEFNSAYPNEKERNRRCQLIREDGAFIEAGENDNLIVQKLRTNTKAFGIFGYSYLEQNGEIVQGSAIDGVMPSFESISSAQYPFSRPLFVYMKDAHIKTVPSVEGFVEELVSENAIGEEGYLTFKGLVPLKETVRENMRQNILDKF